MYSLVAADGSKFHLGPLRETDPEPELDVTPQRTPGDPTVYYVGDFYPKASVFRLQGPLGDGVANPEQHYDLIDRLQTAISKAVYLEKRVGSRTYRLPIWDTLPKRGHARVLRYEQFHRYSTLECLLFVKWTNGRWEALPAPGGRCNQSQIGGGGYTSQTPSTLELGSSLHNTDVRFFEVIALRVVPQTPGASYDISLDDWALIGMDGAGQDERLYVYYKAYYGSDSAAIPSPTLSSTAPIYAVYAQIEFASETPVFLGDVKITGENIATSPGDLFVLISSFISDQDKTVLDDAHDLAEFLESPCEDGYVSGDDGGVTRVILSGSQLITFGGNVGVTPVISNAMPGAVSQELSVGFTLTGFQRG
ncbi:hypothetical protein Mgrana_00069 [Meiothermus granaticius NBRC 107808]|uniref:Uncharacterized protein n=2 Tax=Meiothermus TaxID=65551 RepID=A0A399FCM4_9DEIN|nr:hypothetical protein Mgrana_00069 [Meiothermus granaticius NBRC 107808]